MPSPATTWLHVSGYRFLLRRIECALLFGDVCAATGALRARTTSLALGCVLAIVAAMGCAFVALLRPQSALGQAPIVMGRESGALYVRVDDVWHPVLNLASARLIAATNANPQPVSESELGHTKRGPLLGIPGAPQLLDQPLAGAESAWAICDSDNGGSTTVVVGPAEDSSAQVLTAEQMILVATESGSPTYLLYGGRRAVVDLADPAVVWALRLQGRVPHVVAQSLLNAVPEAPRITAPRIRGGGRASVGLPGFLVGGVVRITRASGDEYYVVLEDGVQRIGQVAADLLRFGDSQGSVNVPTVAPDVIRVAPIVNTLPVSAFPDRPPTPVDGSPGRAVTNQTRLAAVLLDVSTPNTLNADFDLMRSVAGITDARNEEIRAMLQAFIGRMSGVPPSVWGGLAAARFQDVVDRWNAESTRLYHVLHAIADTIRHNEAALREAGQIHARHIAAAGGDL